MGVSSNTLSVLMALGLSGDELLEAVRAIEQDIDRSADVRRHPPTSADPVTERRRAYDRERQERKRAEERASKIIASPPSENPPTSADSPNGPYIEPTSSLSIEKLEVLGGVGERAKLRRGTRLAADWEPSATDISFAQAEGMCIEAIRREAAKYRDYWIAVPGSKGVKTDWPATWRNWIRRNHFPQNRDSVHETPSDRMRAAFTEVDGLFASRRDHEAVDIGRSNLPALSR